MLENVSPLNLLNSLEARHVEFWLQAGVLKFRAPQGVMTEDIIAQLKQHKPDLIELLQARELTQKLIPSTIPGTKHDAFPVSDVQSAYLIGRQSIFELGGTGCHGYFELEFEYLDCVALTDAWNQIIARHDMLRAVIFANGTQRILPEVEPFDILFYSDAGARERLRQAMSHRVYNTEVWPLFDIKVSKSKKFYLHFSIDLLIADFLSIQIILSELLHLYHDCGAVLRPLALSFKDVIAYEEGQKRTAKYNKARDYWQQRIKTLPACPALPYNRCETTASPDSGQAPQFDRYEVSFSEKDWQILEQQCQHHGITPSSLLLTIYSEVIGYWSDDKHFSLNLTVMNREALHPDVMKMVGDFTSVNLLKIDLNRPETLLERTKSQQNQLWLDLEHKSFSGIEVMRELARQNGSDYARMPVVFTSALVSSQREQVAQAQHDLNLTMCYGISQTPQVWIDCQIMNRNHQLWVNWDVISGILPKDTISAMFNAYQKIIRDVLSDSSVWDRPITVALPETQHAIRAKINSTPHSFDDLFLHQAVLAQAEKTPNALALIADDRQLTYYQLVVAAQQLAQHLPRRHTIAVAIGKRSEQIISTLAILLSDGVYLPLDIAQPISRMQQIIDDANVKIVLVADRKLGLALSKNSIVINVLKNDSAFVSNATGTVSDQPVDKTTKRLAYIIYTSGSTGKPKGVMISHHAAMNTLFAINHRFAVGANDRILGLAKLSFDLSVYDIFGALTCGATLVLPSENALKNPTIWAHLISQYNVSVWNSVPAQMNMLTQLLIEERGQTLPTLKKVMLSGDWIPVELPHEINQCFPQAEIYSLGGATEAAIWSIYYPIDVKTSYQSSIPYGFPLANQRFAVKDVHGNDCPDWVSGELQIGGEGIALGYWQDAEKTRAQFYTDSSGQRWYRTGDFGFYQDDGVLIFAGRKDNQIKIRGNRIELGEIESAFERQSNVSRAVVIARGNKQQKYLQAYIEPSQKKQKSSGEICQFSKTQKHLDEQAKILRASIRIDIVRDFVYYSENVALMHMNNTLYQSGGLDLKNSKKLTQIMASGNYASHNKALVGRWLQALKKNNYISQNDKGYTLKSPIDDSKIDSYWQQCYKALEKLGGDRELVHYLERSSKCLPELLRGVADPLELLFPEGSLDVATSAYQKHVMSQFLNQMLIQAVTERVEHLSSCDKTVRILEVGAGVGGTSNELIPRLQGMPVKYTFTDVSLFFTNAAQKRYKDYDFVDYGLYNINLPALVQGLNCGDFDIIIANNVMHNAIDIEKGFVNLRELLSSEGWLIFIEATRDNYQLMTSMEFKQGLTDYQDDRLQTNSPFTSQTKLIEKLHTVNAEKTWAFPDADDELDILGQSLVFAQFNSQRNVCNKAELMAKIATELPEYMLPSQLAIMEKLPLTSHGKIDRQSLPELTTIQPEIRQENLDELEGLLLSTCREIIGNPRMSASDDFFSAGGDSLLITQWVSHIRQELGEDKVPWEKTMRQFLQTPTVYGMADFLRSQQSEQATAIKQKTLAKIKRGTGAALIIIHDGSGDIIPCLNLIERLGNTTVYSISVTDNSYFLALSPKTLIVDLAQDYKVDIEQELAIENCHLFGFCMGGLISFELARLCLEEGKPVKSLTIASSYQIPYRINDTMMVNLALTKEFGLSNPWPDIELDELEKTYLALLKKNPSVVDAENVIKTALNLGYENLAKVYRQHLENSTTEQIKIFQALFSNHADKTMHHKDIASLYVLFHHSVQSVCHYQPSYYTGNLTFACQQEASYLLPTLQDDMTAYWQRVCLGDIQLIALKGNHFSCMQADHVLPLANHLKTITGARS